MPGTAATQNTQVSQNQAVAKQPPASQGDKKLPADLYAVLFFLLLDAAQIRNNTVLIQSKVIRQNANIQDRLNKDNGDIHFSILPPKAGQNTINAVQEKNQEYAAQREDIQNELITTRQKAQVEMTQASTNVNLLQQDASEDSGWLKTLNTIFKVIDQISPGATSR